MIDYYNKNLRNLLSGLQDLKLKLVKSVLDTVEDFDETTDDITDFDDRIGNIQNVIEIVAELINR